MSHTEFGWYEMWVIRFTIWGIEAIPVRTIVLIQGAFGDPLCCLIVHGAHTQTCLN